MKLQNISKKLLTGVVFTAALVSCGMIMIFLGLLL